MRMCCRCILLGWLLAFALAPGIAQAEIVVSVSVGWGGGLRPDRWTPVYVTAQTDDPTPVILSWYVPRPGREAMVIQQSVTLNPKSGTFPAFLPIGPDPSAVHLTVSDARTGRTLGYWPSTAVSPMAFADVQVRQPVFVGVSGEGPAMRFLDEERYAVSFLDAELLPERAIGFDGLDVLALNRPQLARLESAQQQAIVAWVRGGGRLLVWLDLQPLPADTPLLSLLPERIEQFTMMRIGDENVPYTELVGVPTDQLVTRASQGLGEVIFLHVPPEVAARAGVEFMPQEARPEFVNLPALPAGSIRAAEQAAHGQRGGLIPLFAAAILLGPVDWLILRSSGRRTRRWITLPGWMGMFMLLIWYMPARIDTQVSATLALPPGGDARPTARALVATTGAPLIETDDPQVAELRQIGRPFWRTIGFDRTTGPIRDVVFHVDGDSGMTAGSLHGPAAAFVAEGTAFADEGSLHR